jgi:hypothetical protein
MPDSHDPQFGAAPEPEPPHGTAAGEAQHAQHASHDPFDRRVAITMVVIAACLAGVKVLGHRSHNETLQLQIEADTKHTKAGVFRTKAVGARTEASNQWAFYQAKKLRQHFYEGQQELAALIGREDSASAKAAQWKANVERYRKDTEEIAEEAKKLTAEAKEHDKEADHLDHEAVEKTEKAEHSHRRSDFFDIGEMGVELALVLCSVAILTKRPPFWYGGIALGACGAALAAIGLVL